ncbi:MAG: ketoacyl-ACP synthase III [Gemmatimonadota bacterium]|nr:ketoacyl-ACP synthase III [Gemmatimonadota bacterium]MDQ8146493.1 ketoacyl-ACP synthase III [Gemmatimonadota bacterium]MDQ8148420.1 ketoacyl-ACP synthase III [Gemmatimonadota bacterium]MDQ8157538.1 ketoacyl-ACP synthase III [Gemmatimonadota bacterium]MDQ8176211.1 ketoacyl-ACP synthase III [Gemmatimonadota bacterium]
MKRPYAMFAGTGHAVPRRALTNDEFAAMGIETSDEWIRERTGIRQRYIAGDGETLTSLVTEASRQAMADAGVHAGELDAIILGTVSPDRLMPATAVEVQAALGASRAVAFDLGAACSGWLYSAQVAEGLLATGQYETILVIGGEVLSRIVNWKDRNTCVLFGDGAGATIVRRSTKGRGILSAYMRSDGNLADLLHRPKGGGCFPMNDEVLAEGSHYIQMSGREVFKHAVRSMADAADRALDGAKLSGTDVDLMIPHQANIRIIEATAKHANIPMEKVFVNVDRFGNTSAASIPIALDEARQQGRIVEGSTVLFAAFGAGFTWGSMVVRF